MNAQTDNTSNAQTLSPVPKGNVNVNSFPPKNASQKTNSARMGTGSIRPGRRNLSVDKGKCTIYFDPSWSLTTITKISDRYRSTNLSINTTGCRETGYTTRMAKS